MRKPNQYNPFTWEGCVVKIADKIAYLGRDIEDAITLKILSISQVKELFKIIRPYSSGKIRELNNTVLIHNFIIDLCKNSSPDNGITLSKDTFQIMESLKKFNSENIYFHQRLNNYRKYAELIINSIYQTLKDFYCETMTLHELNRYSKIYPTLVNIFSEWLVKYAYPDQRASYYKNAILYNLKREKDYYRAILDFISGMTDSFSIKIFDEITTFC